MTTHPLDLTVLRGLMERADYAPWTVDPATRHDATRIDCNDGVVCFFDGPNDQGNADLIVCLVNHLPEILAMLAAGQRVTDRPLPETITHKVATPRFPVWRGQFNDGSADGRIYYGTQFWPSFSYLLTPPIDAAAQAADRAREEALEEAARWHDAEIARLEKQIKENDEYSRRSDTCPSEANEYYRIGIDVHRRSVATIRAPQIHRGDVMKLDRNVKGLGKYALVRLRGIENDSEAGHILHRLADLGYVDFGATGAEDEFFVIKLRDWNANRALLAYAKEAATGGNDPELGAEVRELARRSGPYSPFCKTPD